MQDKWPGRPELLSNRALEAWMGALIEQINTANGLASMCRASQKKRDLQNAEFMCRHMLAELMREYNSRDPVGDISLDDLRAELADFA